MPTDMDALRSRILQLVEYLGITLSKFAKNCGMYSNHLANAVNGKENVTPGMLFKIIERYPVRVEWLKEGRGEMWEVDYFQKIFKDMDYEKKSDKEKLTSLLEIFDISSRALATKIGVSFMTLHRVSTGYFEKFPPEVVEKMKETYPFIPDKFFE